MTNDINEYYEHKEHNKKTALQEYQRMHVTTINLNEKTLEFLRYLKNTGHGLSVSEIVREMIGFAMPYFLTTALKIDDILENKLTDFTFENPKILMHKIKKQKTKTATLKEMHEKYPNLTIYKGINEE